MTKKRLSLFLTLVALICLLSFAGSVFAQNTIVDSGGKTVKIPESIEKIIITCYGGATHELTVLGARDRIIAQPDMKRFPILVKMFPEFSNSPQVGSFDNVNIEEILKLEPDVVIGSVAAEKGNKSIEEAGIQVVQVLTGRGNIEALKDEFLMIGNLIHEEARASELVAYWDEKINMVKERVSKIPEDQKIRVYYMLGSTLHTNGGGNWGQSLITAAGGINVAEEIGTVRDIEIEQLIKWNPQAMILSENEGKFIPIQEVLDNPQLKDIDAVKNKKLYLAPIGAFWWDRPSPESVLGIMWLAKSLYPELFADVDLHHETKYFYETYYEHPVSDEEIESFLNPVR